MSRIHSRSACCEADCSQSHLPLGEGRVKGMQAVQAPFRMCRRTWERLRWRCWGESGGGRSGQHGETEPAQVFVEGQTGHMIQERSDDDERDGVTERQAMISAI